MDGRLDDICWCRPGGQVRHLRRHGSAHAAGGDREQLQRAQGDHVRVPHHEISRQPRQRARRPQLNELQTAPATFISMADQVLCLLLPMAFWARVTEGAGPSSSPIDNYVDNSVNTQIKLSRWQSKPWSCAKSGTHAGSCPRGGKHQQKHHCIATRRTSCTVASWNGAREPDLSPASTRGFQLQNSTPAGQARCGCGRGERETGGEGGGWHACWRYHPDMSRPRKRLPPCAWKRRASPSATPAFVTPGRNSSCENRVHPHWDVRSAHLLYSSLPMCSLNGDSKERLFLVGSSHCRKLNSPKRS